MARASLNTRRRARFCRSWRPQPRSSPPLPVDIRDSSAPRARLPRPHSGWVVAGISPDFSTVSLSRNSRTMRSAVFLPMPGIRVRPCDIVAANGVDHLVGRHAAENRDGELRSNAAHGEQAFQTASSRRDAEIRKAQSCLPAHECGCGVQPRLPRPAARKR